MSAGKKERGFNKVINTFMGFTITPGKRIVK